MKTVNRQLMLAAVGVLFFSVPTSATTNVAVFNFQMTTDTPDWRWLEKGLSDRIATDFVHRQGLALVSAGWGAKDYQGTVACRKWVTEWVGRHGVVTGYRLLRDLPIPCKPRLWPKNAM